VERGLIPENRFNRRVINSGEGSAKTGHPQALADIFQREVLGKRVKKPGYQGGTSVSTRQFDKKMVGKKVGNGRRSPDIAFQGGEKNLGPSKLNDEKKKR